MKTFHSITTKHVVLPLLLIVFFLACSMVNDVAAAEGISGPNVILVMTDDNDYSISEIHQKTCKYRKISRFPFHD